MCDCCEKFNLDTIRQNGNKKVYEAKIYSAYGERVIDLTLCRIHSIELFKEGEVAFIKRYGNINKKKIKRSPLPNLNILPNAKNIELVIA